MMHPQTMLLPPPQPEVCISNGANGISVRFSTVGYPAAGYVVEFRQGSTSASSRFACQSPADGAGSLEMCIQGLEPGQSYTACVRSVAQNGLESVPSPWSCWITLPMMLQPFIPLPCSNASTPHNVAPTPEVQQQALSPYSILFDEVSVKKGEKNEFGMVKACPPPEITGHEEVLFLD